MRGVIRVGKRTWPGTRAVAPPDLPMLGVRGYRVVTLTEAATATWELLQSSVLPGPSSVVFAPLAVADPPRAPRLAVWAFAGAALGGCIAYLIGAHAFDALGRPMLSALGVGDARIAASEAAFARHGWLLVFLSTISPLSTKLTCIAAGAFGLPIAQFVPAL